METTATLVMTFTDALGNKFTVSVDSPNEKTVTQESVEACMQLILDKNIFSSKGTDLVAAESAKVVETTTRTLV